MIYCGIFLINKYFLKNVIVNIIEWLLIYNLILRYMYNVQLQIENFESEGGGGGVYSYDE